MTQYQKPLWLEWAVILLIRLMIAVTRKMPLVWARKLGRWVGFFLYRLNRRMRWVAIRNLELAYPDWSPSQRSQVARCSVQSTGELMAEMGRLWTQPWARTESMLETDGLEHVMTAHNAGQGVIVLGPHLGNWELLGMHLATLGKLVALYEPLALNKLDRLVLEGRQVTGGKLVPTSPTGIAELVRSIRGGGITGILPDQVPGNHNAGFSAPFYGVPCSTASLASKLIRKSRAATVMGAVVRTPRGFRAIYRPAEPGVESDDMLESLGAINLGVEKLIRGYEKQYQWQYKRFRSHPAAPMNYYDWNAFPLQGPTQWYQ